MAALAVTDETFVQRTSAEAVLKELQAQPDAWTKVDTILERSTTEQTKFFALQVSFDSLASQQWLCIGRFLMSTAA